MPTTEEKKKRNPVWDINVAGSSNLHIVKYNVKTKKLMVEFKVGSRYVYSDVDFDTIVALTLAESVGSFFSKNIRNRFDVVKL